jgi:biopolymer transport protein ExbD
MRRHIAALKAEADENEINLTPMLDVVFIMLIFFIVTASFIREAGIETNRPDQQEDQPVVQEEGAILVVIDNNDDIMIDNRVVDIRSVRSLVERAHAEDPERQAVIQAAPNSTTDVLVQVMDSIYQVGDITVSITTSE